MIEKDEITIIQKREISKQSKRIRKALDAILDVARSMGVAHPFLYFESEGRIHVLDRDHPNIIHNSSGRRDSQAAIVFTLPDRTPHGTDVGAW